MNIKTLSLLTVLSLLLVGCLTTPVSDTGGANGNTVLNSNPTAISTAAQSVFANSGYHSGPSNFPSSISFDKPAGLTGKILYGSYGVTTTVRVKLVMTPIPGTNNYRLSTHVTRVSDAGEAGFEDTQKMLGAWSSQFKPLLQQISAQAANAGPGY